MQSWQPLLDKLLTFKQVYGHCNVPHPWEEDPLLSQWVVNLRLAQKRLPEQLLEALNGAGFDFALPQISWQQYYQQLERFHHQHGHLHLPANEASYHTLGNWIEQQRASQHLLSEQQWQALNDLGFIWQKPSRTDAQWLLIYEQLKAFHHEHGHCNVPVRYEQNPALGRWVSHQRRQQEAMPRYWKDKLDAIGFLWKQDMEQLQDQAWQVQYEQLCEFKKQYGHARVSYKYKDYYSLFLWCVSLRKAKERLSQQRRALLDAVGFVWSLEAQVQAHWQARWETLLGELHEFKAKYGHARVPRIWEPNQPLAEWVSHLRRNQKKLSPDWLQRLQAVGFVWQQDKLSEQWQQWQQMYEQLKAFYHEHGHTRVPARYPKNQYLRHWVVNQRILEQSGKLSFQKKHLLDQIPFEWSGQVVQYHKQHWDRMYQRLEQFYQQHGHSKVSTQTGNEKDLGHWVSLQRREVEKLTQAQKQKLQQVDFAWQQDIEKDREDRWQAKYEQLQVYVEQQGHCRLSKQLMSSSLFDWAVMQRKAQDTMPAHRIEQLKQLGFTFPKDNARQRQEQWQSKLAELTAFQQQYGHCRVPHEWPENKSLSFWVAAQRQKWNKLSAQKQAQLAALGFEPQVRPSVKPLEKP